MGGVCTSTATKVLDPKPGSTAPSKRVQIPPAQNTSVVADLNGIVPPAKLKAEADINKVLVQVKLQPVLGTIEIMQDFSDKEVVQEECLQRVQQLFVEDGQNIQAFIDNGGLKPILKAMELHKSQESLLTTYASALRQIASTSAGQTAIASVGGLQATVTVIDDHSENAKLFETCCQILFSMATHNQKIKMRIGTLGGISAILKGMEKHEDSPQVQQKACSVLRVLVPNSHNQDSMGAKGGIKVVIKALQKYTSVVNLQVEGCRVLCNIAYSHRRNQELVGEHGGLAAVILAMEQHLTSPEVQQHGCAALRNAAANNVANKERIVSLSGLRAVKSAMERHSRDEAVVDQGLWAVRDIVADCPQALAKAHEIDAVQHIESLRASHSGCSQICASSREALKVLQEYACAF